MSDPRTGRGHRVPQRAWVGLVAVAVYLLGAALLANLLTDRLQPADPAVDLALGHFPVLIPLIVIGVVFVHRSGWTRDVWRTPSARETTPARWWMLAIPLLLLVNAVITLATAPADRWSFWPVVLLAAVFFCVGFGEELYIRGILRASVRAHHGETVTLVVTSLVFGLAHSVALLAEGVPLSIVAFTVGATAVAGATYYAAFRATGTLWVPILLHALDDFGLGLTDGSLIPDPAPASDPGAAFVTIQIVVYALMVAFLVSCIRQDVRTRADRRQVASR